MDKDWTRTLTLNERLYSIGEELNPPFAIQFIIEGESRIDSTALQSAIDKLSIFYPVLFLKREQNKWNLNGQKPLIVVHDKACPSDFSAAVYRKKLNAEEGQCFEFHLFQTQTSTILFRVLHSAMDGIGALQLMYALAALLRGEDVKVLIGHPTEKELRTKVNIKPKWNGGGFASKWKGLIRKNEPGLPDFSTELIQFSSTINNSIGKIAHWQMAEIKGAAQFLIPVNCRRHGFFTAALSNLSLPIYLKTKPEQSPLEIQAQLLAEMASNKELGENPLEKWAQFTPKSILKKLIQLKVKNSFKSNNYAISGYISDLGFVDLDALSFEGFKVRDFYSIPVYTATVPICFLIVHHKFGTRICFSASSNYAVDSLKAALHTALAPALEPSIPALTLRDGKIMLSRLEVELMDVWTTFIGNTLNDTDVNASFSALGGESLALLFIVEAVGAKYCPTKQGQFLGEVLKLASSISIREMAKILQHI